MAPRKLPPIVFLKECFRYDAETGAFVWRHRPNHHFASAALGQAWNSRHAGTPAFVSIGPDGYCRCEVSYNGGRHRLTASRVAFALVTGEEPPMVDHRNGVKTDNRFTNFRAADASSNGQNRTGLSKNPLPKGVSFQKGRFEARIGIGRKKLYAGTFASPAEAHAAYRRAAQIHHGAFSNPGPAKPSVFD